MDQSSYRWWQSPKGMANQRVLNYVRTVDAVQASTYNKFIRCAALYDMPPKPRTLGELGDYALANGGRMHENAIASAVNTVDAQIATADIRATFDTDDADWSVQRKAKHLEWYAEAIGKLLGVSEKCQRGFKACAIKGTGINKVYIDAFDQIKVDAVMVDDLVVDEIECRNGPPRQMHYRVPIDREELKAQFPQFADRIEVAQSGFTQNPRLWAGYRPLDRHEVMVIESWHLPIGVKDKPGYRPGRHTIVIEGVDLLDEEWHKTFFPFAAMFWEKPSQGWYGIGLVERNAGLQRALNRRNLQIERQLDLGAFPTTWVHASDAALKTQVLTKNEVGRVAGYTGVRPPQTDQPTPVTPQLLEDPDRIGSKIFQNSGVSRMAAQSVKPSGVETGVALREYRDQTTQRFAQQERSYERFHLDTILLIIDCAKDLGSKAPQVMRKTRFGGRKIPWSQVDMTDVRVQIGAASTLSRTRAGRLQTVVEWAQAGIISQDDARRLLDHPDLESAMSLYDAAVDNADACIEEIADGKVVMPEPYMNLKLLVWRAQQRYLRWQIDGAPEDILENLRTLIVQAAWMVSGGDASSPDALSGMGPDESMPNQVGPAGGGGGMPPPGAPPPMPMGPGGMGMPQLPMGPPMMGPPQAAFAPHAMQLSPFG